MFYNMGGQGPSPFVVHIGSLVTDLKPFVIGLQSSIIIIPVNVLIVQIFRNFRKNEKEKRETSYDVNEDELEVNKVLEREDEYVVEGVKIENQNPREGNLPYCFIYVAYGICFLASAASIFFTLLYSIQWGKGTAEFNRMGHCYGNVIPPISITSPANQSSPCRSRVCTVYEECTRLRGGGL